MGKKASGTAPPRPRKDRHRPTIHREFVAVVVELERARESIRELKQEIQLTKMRYNLRRKR